MKLSVLVVGVVVALVSADPVPTLKEDLTVFGYLSRFGIPEADRIRKSEEALISDPTRIVGGQPALANQFPYQAGLVVDLDLGQAVCGAALLTTNRLVTAAHCWFDGANQAFQLTVVLGSTLLFSGGERISTTEVKLHEAWDPSLIQNDIAVIYLPRSVTFSANISPIELPNASEVGETFAHEIGIASGFGLNVSPGGSIAQTQFLSWVDLPIMTNSACWWRFPGVIQSSNICGNGAGGRSTCPGDSGGPFVVTRGHRRVLVGLTSFGIAFGCHLGWPGVFVRVTSYNDWIRNHLKN